jgi:DNA-binding XRE family transcriptional regulator
VTTLSDLIRRDRKRWRLSVEEAARWFHVTPRHYRDIEDGSAWPDWDTYDRICKVFGWPQTFLNT